MLVLKGDGDIVEEALVPPRDGLKGPPDDVDVIEEEERVVFVVDIGCLRPTPTTSVIHSVQPVNHLQRLRPIEACRFRLRNKILSCLVSVSLTATM